MSATRKLVVTAGCFALALGMVGLAAATGVVGPLFGAWAPLLVVPWALTRPEPGLDPQSERTAGRRDPGAGRAAEPLDEPTA